MSAISLFVPYAIPLIGWVLIWVFAKAFLFSLVLVCFFRLLASKIGAMDLPNERKVHSRPMPRSGGMGIVISFFLSSILVLYFASHFLSQVHRCLSGFTIEFVAILGGGLLIAILGLVDDLRGLSPYFKLAVEFLVSLALVLLDIRITLFIPSYWFSLVITSFWILLITNAFNLLDNMDGLSAGVAFIAAGIFLVVAIQTHQWNIAFLLAAFLGSLLGFLCYNFPPATIFMGDCGSLFIGYMMAVLTIHATFYQRPFVSGQTTSSGLPIALPLLIMAVPIFDTLTVVYLRWKQKQPIFKADKQHFSHRLVKLGMSHRQAVFTIYLVTLATGISSTLLYQINLWGGILVIVQLVAILFVIHILERVGASRHNEEHQSF